VIESTEVLSREELRVLGSLAEKQLTTPDQYPLTLNALTLACNQRSSRDPVVSYSEQTVSDAVTGAKTKGFARFVHPSHGRSVIRYAHTLIDALGISDRQVALLAVLILRGPQTPGELRARTERMTEFSDLEDLERELGRLAGMDNPLAERLARRPGQSQDRYRHLLGDVSAVSQDWVPNEVSSSSDRSEEPVRVASTPAGVSPEIESELAEIRAELAELRDLLEELRRNLGG
jgi:uncharacterized protein